MVSALILSGCLGKKAAEPAPVQNQVTEPVEEEVLGVRLMSINELMQEGRPLECTWVQAQDKGELDGLIHVDGKRFRNDVTIDPGTESEIPPIESHVLSDGTWLYTWNSLQAGTGTKLELAKLEEVKVEGDTKKETVNMEEKLDFSCRVWRADEALLTPPADVIFTDDTAKTNQMIKDNPINLDKAKAQMCALCAQAPTAEAKADCLKDVQCD